MKRIALACGFFLPLFLAGEHGANAIEATSPSESRPPEHRVKEQRPLRLTFGGDVNLGRGLGQELLRNPELNPFEGIDELWRDSDLRFANLESVLADLGGETVSLKKRLVFAGPPAGANALRRARVSLVSTANNHAWDYGRRALLSTLDLLDREGVAHVGSGRTKEEAESVVTVPLSGKRVGFLAVTAVWNQGTLSEHPASDHVADASGARLKTLIERARPSHDWLIVSYHGGEEYSDYPVEYVTRAAHLAIESGADAFIGHHPHVPQGVEFYRGKPILYSLGNLVFAKVKLSEWTNLGLLAHLTLATDKPPQVALCPITIGSYEPRPLAASGTRATQAAVAHLRRISRRFHTELGESLATPGCYEATAQRRLSP